MASDLPDPATVARPWSVSWPPGVPTGWSYPAVGVHRLLADAARDVPDGVAVRDGAHELTWADLAGLVDDVARALARTAPDRVVLACGGALDAVVVGLATWRVGALLEVLDPTARHDRLPAVDDGVGDGSSDGARSDEEAGTDGAGSDDQPGTDADTGPERVLVVVDRRARGELDSTHPTLLADVSRIVRDRLPGGRLRRLLAGRGPRRRGRERLSDVVGAGGQASLPPVDCDRPALAWWAGSDRVVATQRQVVAAAFQVRLWIPDMATGTEVVAAARGWWRPGGWVLGPVLAALTAATCLLADADVVGSSIPGATIAFAGRGAWEDLVDGGGWRAALDRRRGRPSSATELRVAGVVVDPGEEPIGAPLVERLVAVTEGARVRHAWQPATAVGPVLAQPLYGRFHGTPGALPLPDTVLASTGEGTWVHGPQVAGTRPDGWVRVDDPSLPVAGLLPGREAPATGPRPEAATPPPRPDSRDAR